MMWRDVVDLVPIVVTKNSYGEEVETDGTPRIVFANKKSVRQTEFYQAMADGKKAETVFEVMVADYEEVLSIQNDKSREPKVKHGEEVYRVIRTYSPNGERIELVCSAYPMGGPNGP